MPAIVPARIEAVRLETEGDEWRGEGDEVEKEAARVLRLWVRQPGPMGWRRDVRFELELEQDRSLRTRHSFLGRPEVDGLREVVVHALHHEAQNVLLTDSVQAVLQHVADWLIGVPGAAEFNQEPPQHWAGGGSRRAACTCGYHVPWRWAYLAGYRVRVPAMHPPREGPATLWGMCVRAETNHRVLDSVVPWHLDESAPPRSPCLGRREWWQQVLQDLPQGLPTVLGAEGT